eukprot:jgi/Mesvir1/396/Mv11287-RA.1
MTDAIKKKQDELNAAIKKETDRLTQERLALEAEKKEWALLAKKFDTSLLPGRIRLDVGGTIFATSRSTLLSLDGTFFAGMFSGRFELKPEDDGTYFIDRDPTGFRHILNFLRSPASFPSVLGGLSAAEVTQLVADADFYSIKALSDQIQNLWVPKFTPNPGYALSKNDTAARKATNDNAYGNTLLGNRLPYIDHFTFRFSVGQTQDGSIMVGVAPAHTSQVNTSGWGKPGWSAWTLYLYNMRLRSGPPTSFSDSSYSSGQAKAGDTVDVVVERRNRTISFHYNGQDLGVAYTNVFESDAELYPAVCMYHPADTVTIMQTPA